jgi:hypothetical protein
MKGRATRFRHPHQTDSNLIDENNNVTDNYVHNVNAEFLGGVSMFFGYVHDTQIAHNEIADLLYSGMSLGWGSLFTARPTSLAFCHQRLPVSQIKNRGLVCGYRRRNTDETQRGRHGCNAATGHTRRRTDMRADLLRSLRLGIRAAQFSLGLPEC